MEENFKLIRNEYLTYYPQESKIKENCDVFFDECDDFMR